ncbi:hypothetical protein [Nitrosomonas sp.]|uniref:hypothetical protein n=1 Tax=Nitrosomonas sp. TaxID=42353 RepID=UPI001DFD0FAA|nr:hypothetical protein [Nitrosomonas sp.]MCB1948620.1 hypothetical protein [Nitrosomonas sp.]MCP5243197.1 hypothetical protein [Burkholderiales bacterium]MDR4513976.1 hypothetical protein [Nitrosomonas sp.]
MKNLNKNLLTISMASVALMVAASQSAFAHTRLTVPVSPESSAAHGTTTTAVNIPHGCGDNSVIGNVFFLPDTNSALVQTSANNFETFEAAEGENALSYIVNPPFIRIIKSRDVFEHTEFINDSLGNPLGFWAGGGELPAQNWVGQLPINITAVAIQPDSCARKVVFVPAIANICKITPMTEINSQDPDNPNVDFWTAPDVGSSYDSPSWSYPATYTVERDLANNPLPESCGDGLDVRIIPSAAQMDRDMPVKINGSQVWPGEGDGHTDHSHDE